MTNSLVVHDCELTRTPFAASPGDRFGAIGSMASPGRKRPFSMFGGSRTMPAPTHSNTGDQPPGKARFEARSPTQLHQHLPAFNLGRVGF